MFDSPAKLKNFILWCQKNKVKVVKTKEIEFELSEMAFLPETETFEEINLGDQSTFADKENMTPEEYDELLLWSANQQISRG